MNQKMSKETILNENEETKYGKYKIEGKRPKRYSGVENLFTWNPR